MWPHEIANGKWLLYPMRVELEGGQGPEKKGICSPRPNILHLVRLRGRVGEWVGFGETGSGDAMQQRELCTWWRGVAISRLQYLEGPYLLLPLPCPGCGQQG